MSHDMDDDAFWTATPGQRKDNNDDLAKTDPKALVLDEKELS